MTTGRRAPGLRRPRDPAGLEAPGPDCENAAQIDGLPLFGISLGHQVIAQALGAAVEPLDHAHRGANYPVREADSGRVYITAQNHGYVVQEASWDDPDLVVSHRNVNDGTIEGLAHRELPVFTVQFDPGIGPGPGERRSFWSGLWRASENRREADVTACPASTNWRSSTTGRWPPVTLSSLCPNKGSWPGRARAVCERAGSRSGKL